ncbi:copper amine oxidase N-terminal domain-containing protein [Cohnella thailandensis]|uniref:Copper amine oxidase-like N-terminal domain-containing protein n=1 Tax=Cohnella thailandensis TaxID=557557 RepID=A0A841SWP1_9BACL|nr:copper amine oxidase N-terminal domain-containing protein [Cohnella thailandensis]MBB6636683.1 hypothetical protein [Cohnella thailandensis]MBP1973441.1 hypothetical protein [Cohnella thailandensis]
MFRGKPLLKKGLLSASAVFLLFASTVHASESLQVSLSRAEIYFNNVLKSPSEDLPILSYNGRTYVPLRFLSESSGAHVGYDNATKTIHVDTEYAGEFRSQATVIEKDGDFELAIRSNKSVYSYGEPLSIWSELTYTGESSSIVKHGGLLISYSIKDSDGFQVGQFVTLMEVTTVMKTNDAFMYVFPDSLAVSYDVEKNEIADPLAYFDSAERLGRLEPGAYTVSAHAQFAVGEARDRKHLVASLDITIEP